MNYKFLSLIFVLIFSLIEKNYSQHGYIVGKITDSKTSESLIGVNIFVNELKDIGTITDINGNYKIKIPVGSYSVKASLIGYTPLVRTDVIVTTNGEAVVNIKLSETAAELTQVTVTADYFEKSKTENDISSIVLGAEEVRRSPGSSQDFQRILQSMAGVSFSNDQTNELIVRGGSPNENLTVFDNIEIHSTNHYPNQYNSGGPINMINVDLIEDIQFSTGGFISKYGDKLSSVLQVNTREGTRSNLFSSNVNLSMAGFGAILEGRINEGKGSWIFSARKSYIDLIAGSFGLTAIPYYYDCQFKVAYDLSNIHRLSWTGIYGNDKIFIEGETDAVNDNYINTGGIDSVGVENVDVKQHQYATGITLKSLWSKDIYSLITFSKNSFYTFIDVGQNFTIRTFDTDGKQNNSNILNRRKIFFDENTYGETGLKAEFVYNVNPNYELNFGNSVKSGDFLEDLMIDADTTRFDFNFDGIFDTAVVVNSASLDYNFKLFEHFKYYAYINNKFRLLDDRITLNIGFRYDYFSYPKQGNFSPRFSISYFVIPALTSINFSYGEFYQTQSYPTYGDRYKTYINRFLKNTHSRHFVFGIEHILADGLKLSIEGYQKKYDNIPVSEQFINFNNRTLRSDKNLNVGKKNSYGFDVLLQQKLVKDIYGTIAYSKMWSKFEDPRFGKEGNEYPSEFEFPDVLTIIFGKRFKDLRNELDEMPFYIKYPSYILPFSDDMEISVRYRYASGKAYTPNYFSTFEQHREGGLKWSKGSWLSTNEINSVRYPDYQRLDISFSSRFNFEKWSMSFYLSIENLFNKKNIAGYQYNSDGTIETIYQIAIIPVAGVELNF